MHSLMHLLRPWTMLCTAVLAVVLAGCPGPQATECEKTGILCPEGTHCAGVQAICIKNDKTCGDGKQDPDEECDDGNVTNGDGCSQFCKKEICGNGIPD